MTVKHFIRTLTTAALMVAVVALCGCTRDKSLRVLYWNFQNGMWADEPNNYDNFVEWVKKYDPDICIWCEAQTIYETGTNKACSKESRYLVDNWGELAARFGHQYWEKGGHRDNYPQVITSKLPIEVVEQIVGEEPDSVVTHGAGHFCVEFNGKKVNIVKIIPWFICGFLALAIINSIGWIPTDVSSLMKTASKFLMVSALAAIGLGTSITDFKKAGLAPMFYGVTIDTLVTLTALGVIWLMGLM